MFGADRIAGQFFDAQSLDGARPFLAQLLALLRVQRGEAIVEARIARVREMELNVAAEEPARFLEQRHLNGRHESGMRRRYPVLPPNRLAGAEQQQRVATVLRQQARS